MMDTLVRCGEVFVEGPVQDVGNIRAERVTCAGVHCVLCNLPICHAGALISQRVNTISTVCSGNNVENPIVLNESDLDLKCAFFYCYEGCLTSDPNCPKKLMLYYNSRIEK